MHMGSARHGRTVFNGFTLDPLESQESTTSVDWGKTPLGQGSCGPLQRPSLVVSTSKRSAETARSTGMVHQACPSGIMFFLVLLPN